MIRSAFLGVVSLAVAAGPVLAQQSPDQNAQPAAVATPNPSGAPDNPDLTVASVKLQGGARISKVIGSTVYNDQNEKVGTVDDLIMKDGNRIVIAVISVGRLPGNRQQAGRYPIRSASSRHGQGYHQDQHAPGPTKMP